MEHGFVLLGGDTMAPSGLYARLCYAFLVIAVQCNIKHILKATSQPQKLITE